MLIEGQPLGPSFNVAGEQVGFQLNGQRIKKTN